MITYFSAFELDVNIAAQKMFMIGDFAVTNAMLTGLFGTLLTLIILFYVGNKVKNEKYNRFVGLIQWVFEGLLGQINGIITDRKLARKMTPLAVTIFFVVLINYWLSVLPGLDSIKIGGVPLLRSPTVDLNFTLGLAIITLIAIQIFAIKQLGIRGNINRYFKNPFKDMIGFFEGILDIVSEFSCGLSLAMRLFGNAFAGEILLLVIVVLASFVSTVALPVFIAFEVLIGFVQAYIFFVLMLIFTSLAVGDHNNEEHDKKIEAT